MPATNSQSGLGHLLLTLAAIAAFLLLFLLVLGPQRLRNLQVTQLRKLQPLVGQVKPGGHFLNVSQPKDDSVVQNSLLTVAGQTSAGATVVVITGEESKVVDVDPTGNFSLNLNLAEGSTTVEVISFNQNGEEKTVSREVFYAREAL